MTLCHDETTGQRQISVQHVVTLDGTSELLARVSEREDTEPEPFTLPNYNFRVPASFIPEPEMLEELLRLLDHTDRSCRCVSRKPDGSIIAKTRNCHLDHIDPRSKKGSNQITNRAPLCHITTSTKETNAYTLPNTDGRSLTQARPWFPRLIT